MAAQLSLFAITNEFIIDELRELKPENLSPEEAKQLLMHLNSKIV
jgi:hypothetical protein